MAKKGEARLLVLNGSQAKSINPWDVDSSPEAWTWLSGGPREGEEKVTQDYFARVPWLKRGVNIIATRVSGVPFTISSFKPEMNEDKKIIGGEVGDEVDNSDEYHNAVKFLPNPKKFLWLMTASRQLTGSSYLFKRINSYKVVKGLKYLNPTSVEPVYSEAEKNAGELEKWTRTISTGKGTKDIELKLEEILYSWYADPYVENGPPTSWPALAALTASGVLFSLDEALNGFFEGGMTKQTVFTVPSNTQKEERERIGNILTRMLSGVRAQGKEAKVFNADTMNPVVIGEGMENLNDGGLSKQKREDIAAAFGIPSSKLFSNETGGLGGGGVVQEDEKNFLLETILPEAEAIFEDLNEQVFHPNKYHIEINKQQIDAFQEDEKERSAAVAQLTSSISVNPLAFELGASIMGYDLTDDQKLMLEAIKSDKQSQRDLFRERVDVVAPKEAPNDKEPLEKSVATELSQWQRQALRVGGERSAAEFEPEHVTTEVSSFIRDGLVKCKTDKNIKALFAAVRSLMERGEMGGAVAAATKAALAKATTGKKVDMVLADLAKGHEH